MNARDEIAVTDRMNHRVQIFNSDGKYLRSFGREGNKAGEFKYPTGITFHKNGNIFVADTNNHRIQIFSGEGEYEKRLLLDYFAGIQKFVLVVSLFNL